MAPLRRELPVNRTRGWRSFMTVTSKCVCLLLLLVATPSRSWLFWPKKCSDKQYNGDTHICCNDELHARPEGWDYLICCGKELVNAETHICCRRNNPESGVETRVVERVAGEKRSITCYYVWKEPQKTN
ncbi:hypothetical protein LSAT2_032585 [Lamellibrachia satsuma]|nr:hypothetical protein LSAT2_032585 [Lamellibrachia satsuma]